MGPLEYINNIQLNGIKEGVKRMVGQFSGACLILGSGVEIFKDIKDAKAIAGNTPLDIVATNLSFLAYNGPIQHLVSLHPERLPFFHELAKLLPEERPSHIWTHSYMDGQGIEFIWPVINAGGTSGLFAVAVAIMLGYSRIILCGTPLEGSRRFYDSPFQDYQNNYSNIAVIEPWREASRNWFDDKVRSMSGQSKALLGAPTEEWLSCLAQK